MIGHAKDFKLANFVAVLDRPINTILDTQVRRVRAHLQPVKAVFLVYDGERLCGIRRIGQFGRRRGGDVLPVHGALDGERVAASFELVDNPLLPDVVVLGCRWRDCDGLAVLVGQRKAFRLEGQVPTFCQGAAHRLEALLHQQRQVGVCVGRSVRHRRLRLRELRLAFGRADVVACQRAQAQVAAVLA